MALLGYKMTVKELRLLPFFQYTAMNDKYFNQGKINDEERKIIAGWIKKGYIEIVGYHFTTTEVFWKAVCAILYLAYVDTD